MTISTPGKPVPRPRWERPALATLLAATAVLYLWRLGDNGWANQFYAAAVQAGSQNWTALLFGSSDAANAITVDKTPAALWVMGLSARLFGFSTWSVLVPQAMMGVASVGVLWAAVRRTSGSGAALLAGVAMAATPVAALMFRFNNPDALLVLLLIVAAYCTLRAIETEAAWWWLPLAGVAVGFGFLAKMLQAFLVVPVLAAVFLLAAPAPLRTRLQRLVVAAVALVASFGWYLALVGLWPVDKRPYIGGSQENSILELTLGYNGLGRLTGNETGGLGNLNGDVGWGRLFGYQMGQPIAWLVPAAVIVVAAGLWITRRKPRTDVTRAALLLWGGWLLVTAVVFSFMNGIVHPYYTVALVPAIAAGLGIGTSLLWQHRADLRAATVLSGAVAITALLSFVLLSRNESWQPWLRWAVVAAGLAAAIAVLFIGRFPTATTSRAIAALAVGAALAGPLAYSLATASTAHSGAIPSVGPSSGHGGMPSFLTGVTASDALAQKLLVDADRYTWVAATTGSNSAASYQLATGAPVMAVGGYNGTDPAPTLTQFQDDVQAGRIHYYVIGDSMPQLGRAESGSDQAARISEWVQQTFPAQTVEDVTVYDLST